MTLQSSKIFINNYIMKMIIKNRKLFIGRWQIDIDGITCIQKSSLIYGHMWSTSAMTLLNRRKHYILFQQLFCSKRWVLMQCIYLLMKVINFLLLHIIIYIVGLRLNHYVLFFLKQQQIFIRKILFVVTVVSKN